MCATDLGASAGVVVNLNRALDRFQDDHRAGGRFRGASLRPAPLLAAATPAKASAVTTVTKNLLKRRIRHLRGRNGTCSRQDHGRRLAWNGASVTPLLIDDREARDVGAALSAASGGGAPLAEVRA